MSNTRNQSESPAHSSSFLRSAVSKLFQLLLFAVVSLPTGSVLRVNVKVVVFAIFLAVFIPYLLLTSEGLSLGDVVFLVATAGFLSLWALIGIVGGQVEGTQVLYRLRDIVSTVVVAWLSSFAVRRRLVSSEKLVTVVIYGALTVAIMKISIIIASHYWATNPFEATQSIFSEAPIISGFTPFGLWRVEFPPDLLGSFALFALLAPRVSGVRFGRLATVLITVFLLASGLIAYSRYIWFAYVAAILIAILVARSWKILVLTCVAGLVLGVFFQDFLSANFGSRFVSSGVDSSDELRGDQFRVLAEEFESHPVFGKGMGARAAELVRDEPGERSYVYELEWLAFLMQFGIVGMMGILALLYVCARDLIRCKHPCALCVWAVFAVWLLSGFTNPYLTSSYAGGAFGLFMAMFYRLRTVPAAVGQPA